jgi:hypothetical protein
MRLAKYVEQAPELQRLSRTKLEKRGEIESKPQTLLSPLYSAAVGRIRDSD